MAASLAGCELDALLDDAERNSVAFLLAVMALPAL
jgi:hypothetical protein